MTKLAIAIVFSLTAGLAFAISDTEKIGDGYNPHKESPDGTCWGIIVDNAGVLSTESCPDAHCGG